MSAQGPSVGTELPYSLPGEETMTEQEPCVTQTSIAGSTSQVNFYLKSVLFSTAVHTGTEHVTIYKRKYTANPMCVHVHVCMWVCVRVGVYVNFWFCI